MRLGSGAQICGPRGMRVDELHARLLRALQRLIEARRRQREGLARRMLAAHPARRLEAQRRKLDNLTLRLRAAAAKGADRRRQRLQQQSAVLQALSPRAALGRGYAIVRRNDGTALQSVAGVRPADHLELLLRDGAIAAQVVAVRPEGDG